MALRQSSLVNIKIATDLWFFLYCAQTEHLHQLHNVHMIYAMDCVLTVSLAIYNCSFLCFTLSRAELLPMCTRNGSKGFSVSDSLTGFLEGSGYSLLNKSFPVDFSFSLEKCAKTSLVYPQTKAQGRNPGF